MRGDVIPLRPLTLAELLDSAVELLRRNALGLLAVSAGLAVAEQALLYPLRVLAHTVPPNYLQPPISRLGAYWLLVAFGLGTEAAIIGLLGGLAGRAAVPAMVGGAAPRWPLGRGSRLVPLVGLSVVLAAGAALTAAAGLIPWFFWYLFTGLAAPALIIDRLGPLQALGRSFVMVGRGRWRPGGIRLLGYVAWLSIRVALATGSIAALSFVIDLRGPTWPAIVAMAAWVIVNTVAYAVLGCLDAVLHLENRMRVEGLDLTLGRALRRGVPVEQILGARR
ncbi:MAG: hypothetical protein AUI14_21200 [Actinobacteria bacterium 13_2_20CM_2_71_6]|nr:MAG: hypothetical protein AUI14_21200 [Actinobacteria bacterium 13_2_20CM_2_71_6]